MLENRKNRNIIIFLLLAIALVSNLWLADYASSPEVRKKTIAYLDEKQEKVMEMTSAAATMSVAISMIPDDTATPIANKTADLSTYLMFILCAVFLEKYLVTITGYFTFKFLVPIACALLVINVMIENELCKKFALKILLFGMAIFLIVPVSVKISKIIEETYEISVAIDNEEIEAAAGDSSVEEKSGRLIGVRNAFAKLKKNVEASVAEAVEEFEEEFNNLIEGIAVMIVTSCLIPVAVLFFMIWVIKTIFGLDFNTEILRRIKVIEKKKKNN